MASGRSSSRAAAPVRSAKVASESRQSSAQWLLGTSNSTGRRVSCCSWAVASSCAEGVRPVRWTFCPVLQAETAPASGLCRASVVNSSRTNGGAIATLGYVALAFVMGLRSHSLALISEAGHNLTDFLALGLSWIGVYLQAK